MEFLLFFLFELLLLFFLSRNVSKAISYSFYRITRHKKFTIYLLAFLFFPGTLIHELSHFFMAIILFVRTGEMNLFPQIEGSMIKMGSVEVEKTDPFRRFFIGIAPIIIGTAIILLSLFYFQSITFVNIYWKCILEGYLLFTVGNTMFSSKRDVEGALELLITFAILGIILYVLGLRIPFDQLLTPQRIDVIKTFDMLLLIPICIDIMIIGFIKILFHKK